MAVSSGRSHRLTNVLLAMVVAALVAAPALNAMGAGGPANKAGATGNTLATVPPSSTGTAILSTSIKTSGPEDLIFSLTAECSILTTLYSPGSNQPGASSSSTAQGTLRMWVTFDDKIVAVNSVNTGNPQPQNPSAPGGEADKVTFCHNDRGQKLEDAESPQDGVDTLTTYNETKTANAFNWVYLNAGAATHQIVVYADLQTAPSQCSSTTGNLNATQSCATGYVGSRTLVIQPAHFASTATVPVSG